MSKTIERRLLKYADEMITYTEDNLTRFIRGRYVVERQWFTSIMMDRGNQWLKFNENEGRFKKTVSKRKIIRPVTNKYKATKNALISAITSFDPRLTYAPQTNTLEDQHTASVTTQVVKSIEFEWEWQRKQMEALNWLILTGGVFFVAGYDPNQGSVSMESLFQCAGNETQACSYKSTKDDEQFCPVCEQRGIQSPMIPVADEQGNQETVPVRAGKMTLDVVSPFEMFLDMAVTDIHEQDTIIRVHRKSKAYAARKYGLTKKEMEDLEQAGHATIGGDALRYRTALSHFMSMSEVYYKDKVDIIEVWQKPTAQWKWGFHMVRVGKKILMLESYPFISNEGKVFGPVVYIPFERETGNFYGTTPMFSCIELQRTRNRLEALILMAAMRMGSPVWIVPEPGTQMALTGDAGLVVKWTPTGNGGVAPKRDEGIPVPPSLVALLQMIDQTMDNLVGLSEVMRGMRPPSVRTHSAIEKLDEVARSRQSGLFMNWSLGLADLQTVGFEIFRLVQPEGRYARITGTGTGEWTVTKIESADLIGGVDIAPEAGGTTPRTAIERQAMITTMIQSGLVNLQDPKQVHAIYRLFGLAEMVPEMDRDRMQIAREHDRFRNNVPLQVQPYDNHQMHSEEHREFMLTEEFEDMPDEKKQEMFQHKGQHDQINAQIEEQMQKQQQQQLLAQQALKGR